MEMENTTPHDKLEAALDYVSRGWAVFPLPPRSKIPLKGSRGFKDASKDPEYVRDYYERNPGAGIGIVTGEISGLLVFDLDKGEAGRTSWAELCAKYAQPGIETLTSRTLSDGRHLFLKYPPGLTILRKSIRAFPNIDIRANNHYVVAPPSFGGAYRWLNPGTPIVAPPLWLCLELSAPAMDKPAAAIAPGPAKIPHGQRHDSIKRSIRGYAEGTPYSFILLWKRSLALILAATTPTPEDPFSVGELFSLCLWAWNETKPENQLSHVAAWKMLRGRARDKGDIAFGEPGAGVHNLFIPTPQHLNNSNTSTPQNISDPVLRQLLITRRRT